MVERQMLVTKNLFLKLLGFFLKAVVTGTFAQPHNGIVLEETGKIEYMDFY